MHPLSNDRSYEALQAEVTALHRKLGELTARLDAAERTVRSRRIRWPIAATALLLAVAAAAQSPLVIDRDTGVVKIAKLVLDGVDMKDALSEVNQRIAAEATRVGDEAKALNTKLQAQLQGQLQALQVKNDTQFAELSTRSTGLRKDLDAGTQYILGPKEGCPSGWKKIVNIGVIVGRADVSKSPFNAGGDYGSGWEWTHPDVCKKN
jgi:chromosome segregation ATPase